MHHLSVTEDSAEGAAVNQKRVLGVTADGTMWIYHLVQYAQVLLNQPKHAQSSQPFSPEQRQAWDRWDNTSSSEILQSDRRNTTGCSLILPAHFRCYCLTRTHFLTYISA